METLYGWREFADNWGQLITVIAALAGLAVAVVAGRKSYRRKTRHQRTGFYKRTFACVRGSVGKAVKKLRGFPAEFINKRVSHEDCVSKEEGFVKRGEWEEERDVFLQPVWLKEHKIWVLAVVAANVGLIDSTFSQVKEGGRLCRNSEHRVSIDFDKDEDDPNPYFRVPLVKWPKQAILSAGWYEPPAPAVCEERGDYH